MSKKIGNFISDKNSKGFSKIDFHDFIDMVDSELTSEEMAEELGVSKKQIDKLKYELQRDY